MARKEISKKDLEAAERLRRLWHQRRTEAREQGEPPLTQEQAAHQMDISQTAVSKYLKGKIPLGVNATLRWAELLDVNPREIRDDIDQMAGVLSVNNALLTQVIYEVDTLVKETGYRLPEQKKAALVAAVYASSAQTGQVSQDIIRALLRYATLRNQCA